MKFPIDGVNYPQSVATYQMGWSSKFLACSTCSPEAPASLLAVQVRLRESGARVHRRKTRRLKPRRMTLAKNVGWGNHKSRESWGWKVPYFRDVTWCNHGCWPLTHCQNHGSTTDSLYVWPILAWKNFSCLHFSLAKIPILKVDFGMFWGISRFPGRSPICSWFLAPSPGKKRWKSTIFERWTIEFNRMNSMMMLNYQSVQKGWKTTSDWSRSMIHCLIGWGGTPAGAFCLKTNWYQLCQLIIKRSFEYPPAVCSIHSETNRDNLNCSNICSRFPPMRNAEQNLGTDMISWYKNKKKHILSYIWNMISHPSARGHPPAPPLPWRLTGAACAGAGWHWLQLGHPGVSRWRGAKPCRWGLKVTGHEPRSKDEQREGRRWDFYVICSWGHS